MPRGPRSAGSGIAARSGGEPGDAASPGCDEVEAALAGEDWHRAAELSSELVSSARRQLQAEATDPSPEKLRHLGRALCGRSRALLELGRRRGQLAARPEILKASLADAKSALVLARKVGGRGQVASAAAGYCAALVAADLPDLAREKFAEALAADPESPELQAARQKLELDILAATMDADADDGHSPGTFRWPLSMRFPELPSFEGSALASVSDRGWGPFLEARGGAPLVAAAKAEAMMLDGLSFPLSLAWLLDTRGAARWGVVGAVVHVVVLGATARAEQRIWAETSYWQELQKLLGRQVRFEFVGPELGPAESENMHPCPPPCAKTFFDGRPELTPENTICAVFNGGFGNFVDSGQDSLLWSWWPDLLYLSDRRLLCCFFCANDYADLKGEVAVHASLLGSRFVVAPSRNPFAMATVYSGDDGEGRKEWFNGNSHAYAVCGYEPGARHPDCGDFEDEAARCGLLARVLATVRDVAKAGGDLAIQFTEPPMLCAGRPRGEAASVPNPTTAASPSPAARPPAASPQPPAASLRPPSSPSPVATPSPPERPSPVPPRTSASVVDGRARMEVALPGVSGIGDADLRISDASICLSGVPGFAALEERWPQPVRSDEALAAFSSKKGCLVVKAPLQGS